MSNHLVCLPTPRSAEANISFPFHFRIMTSLCSLHNHNFSAQTQVKLLFPHPWTGNPIKPREMKSSSLRNMFTSDLWESFHQVPRSTNNKILPVTAFISWGELGGKRFSCAVEVHFHALEKNCASVKGWNASQTVCALFQQNLCEERNSPHRRVNSPADLTPGTGGEHRGLTLIFRWPHWAPWPAGQEFPRTFPLQLVLPLPIPSACAPHSMLSCLTYS